MDERKIPLPRLPPGEFYPGTYACPRRDEDCCPWCEGDDEVYPTMCGHGVKSE